MNPIKAFTVQSLRTLRLVGVSLAVAMAAGGVAPDSQAAEDEDTFYLLGISLGRSLADFQLSEAELETVQKGMTDVIQGKSIPEPAEEQMMKIGALRDERAAKITTNFLAKAKREPGAQVQDSGLIYFDQKAGEGASPSATDTVKVHYHGTLWNGTVFDSSTQRGEPVEFPLDRVISCWTEGVGMMKVGGKAKLVCPPDIAYGGRGAPPAVPPGAALTFEVELLEIKAASAPAE
jgi:FKBP-type peptidyl-prolyl cis-trans isomerase